MPLILKNTPDEWDGSFVVAARALIRDLLLDGDILLAVTDDEGSTVEGTLTRLDADGSTEMLVFTDGRAVDLGDVHEIEVP